MSFGLGAKYIFENGYGMKMVFDYFSSSESLDYAGVSLTRALSGPRFQMGISYRF